MDASDRTQPSKPSSMSDIKDAFAIVLAHPVMAAHMAKLELRDRADGPMHAVGCDASTTLDEAVEEADAIVEMGGDDVGATLYAFGRRPVLFAGAFRAMTYLLTAARAAERGHCFDVDHDEFDALLRRLCAEVRPPFSLVSTWLAEVRVDTTDSPPSSRARPMALAV